MKHPGEHMADFQLQLEQIDAETAFARGWVTSSEDNLTMPIHGRLDYYGRVDAVVSYFIEGFLREETFESGDKLWVGEILVSVK